MTIRIRDLPFDPAAPRGLSDRVVTPERHVGSIGAGGSTMEPAMALALDANFGSVDRWRTEFAAMGKARGGGSRWLLLTFEPRDGTLVNRWAADPLQPPAGGLPIVALDIGGHAARIDDGAAAGWSVDASIDDIDWAPAYRRYQHAVHGASEPFGASHDELSGAVLIDVRRAGVFDRATTLIPGAQWRDPAAVGSWASALAHDREVVVYCVYGHEVGRATAMRLRAHGLQARYLRGGIDGWQAAGRPLEARGTAPSPPLALPST